MADIRNVPLLHSEEELFICLTVDIRNVLFQSVGGMTIYLPNGSFWLAVYWQLVMSSMVGPVGWLPDQDN